MLHLEWNHKSRSKRANYESWYAPNRNVHVTGLHAGHVCAAQAINCRTICNPSLAVWRSLQSQAMGCTWSAGVCPAHTPARMCS